MSSGPSSSPQRVYTLDEVKQHNTASDCWVVVDQQVLNLSKFLPLHPGGVKIVLPYAGTDATEIFHSLHNDYVLTKYRQLIIGTLQPSQPSSSSSSSSSSSKGKVVSQKREDSPVPFSAPWWWGQEGVKKNPYYTESHRKFALKVREWTEKEIAPYAHEWDEAKSYPDDLYSKGYKAGIFAGAWPAEYGGTPPEEGHDPFYALIVLDELYRTGFGGMASLFAGSIGLPPILRVGSVELKDRVARDCITGKKSICLAISEPWAGSDVANLRTTARQEGDYYIVSGQKKYITGGCKADYFTVACRTGEKGFFGVSLLMLEKGLPGFTITRMKTQGWWASNTAFLLFEDVKVPAANLIGQENFGFQYIMYNFNGERFQMAIQANSLARTCLTEAIIYARKRRTFGKRLVDHQVIRHKIAEMARKVETTHAYLEQMAYQMKQNVPDHIIGGQLALCKVQATLTLEFCARESSQILGGASYIRGGIGEKVERIYREVRVMAIGGGSEEIMRDLAMRQAKL